MRFLLEDGNDLPTMQEGRHDYLLKHTNTPHRLARKTKTQNGKSNPAVPCRASKLRSVLKKLWNLFKPLNTGYLPCAARLRAPRQALKT